MRTKTIAAGVAAVLIASVCTAGTGSAEVKEPMRREAVARHSFSVPTAAIKVRGLLATKASWAGEYADDITFITPGDHQVTVLVKDHVTEIYDRIPADLKPYVTVAHGGVGNAAGSPSNDLGGWTGGNHIWSSGPTLNNFCTEGFAWKSWDTGAVLGSTARHCYETGTYIDWKNNSRLLGTRTQAGAAPSDDVLFLRPAPGTSFNASIWVGLPGGGEVERTVTSAARNKANDIIAFYGRTGGGTATVTMTGEGLPLYEGYVWTNSTKVRVGDSGGPVFRTHSDGTVEARGTISQYIWDDKNGNGTYDPDTETVGMIFVDATYTSADMRASIYTP